MKDLYILDACALIALLNKEPGSEIVENIFRVSQSGSADVIINKLNFLEVYYDMYRKYGKGAADDLLELPKKFPKKFPFRVQSEITDTVFQEAGRLKASYRISIADSIALAEASTSGGSLLTSDHHEFDVIEKSEKNIKFHWIR